MRALALPIAAAAVVPAGHLAAADDAVLASAALELAPPLLLWAAATWVLARGVAVAVRLVFLRRSKHPPPPLLVDLLVAGLWLVSVSIVAVRESGISPSAAFTTSGVLIAVVGFAVRSLRADLFYGLTMAVERPFEIGHWVKLTNRVIGRVDTMTWRAVKRVTKDNLRVVVPNASLAGASIINYDQPTGPWRQRPRIVVGHDVAPERVKALLDAVVRQVPACVALTDKPEAVIEALSGTGIEWELRFWLPDCESSMQARVHEIREQDIEPMLRANPELAGRFAEVVTDRRLTDERRVDARSRVELEAVRTGMVEALQGRARDFFKLGEPKARVGAD
jgi:small-conductance mechanosensitive channel